MTKRDSHQSLREMLISLTVDNEDKDNLLKLLKQKCLQRTEELARVQNDYTKMYEESAKVRFHFVYICLNTLNTIITNKICDG